MSTAASRGQRRIDEIGEESRRRILDAAEGLFADYTAWVRGDDARRRDGLEHWARVQRPRDADPEAAATREHAFAVALNGALIGIHLQALIDPGSFDLDEAMRAVVDRFGTNVTGIWDTPPAA
ncbi:hypothetical protein [Umezawaea sp. Da 62-37]|uniref:hypothetical protein n=1 Tax=Umezawaea sp. Da 62-37 TaxID=3075927 RepID=UPI0028F74538|nr:hypothetical protein [Umezawaea sp. Da 62-37]WNV85659.1 hypothetical protein RM788_47340 [Umezawaea sp. Da 62-37]